MNLGDVKARVKRQFGDESGVQITDDDITRWVNDAVLYIVMNNDGLLEKINLVDIVANQQEYDMPSDLLTLKTVHLKCTPDALSHIYVQGYDIQKFDAYVDGWDGTYYGSGIPFVYTVYSEKFKLFPIPDSDIVGGIKYYYNRKPNILSGEDDSAELDLPITYHNGVVHYCLQQAYELDENMDSYNRKGADVQDTIRMNKFKQGRANEQAYQSITLMPDDAW